MKNIQPSTKGPAGIQRKEVMLIHPVVAMGVSRKVSWKSDTWVHCESWTAIHLLAKVSGRGQLMTTAGSVVRTEQ